MNNKEKELNNIMKNVKIRIRHEGNFKQIDYKVKMSDLEEYIRLIFHENLDYISLEREIEKTISFIKEEWNDKEDIYNQTNNIKKEIKKILYETFECDDYLIDQVDQIYKDNN